MNVDFMDISLFVSFKAWQYFTNFNYNIGMFYKKFSPSLSLPPSLSSLCVCIYPWVWMKMYVHVYTHVVACMCKSANKYFDVPKHLSNMFV